MALCLSLCILPRHAHTQQPSPSAELPDSPGSQMPGIVSGTVVDRDGALVADAQATLIRGDQAPRVTTSDTEGRFTFVGVPPGSFQLTVSAAGFAPQQTSFELHPGETYEAPQFTLSISATVDVQVTASREEIAQAQIEAQEKQRVLGIVPNFFVSYVPNAVPLTTKQKFQLAWKSSVDPTAFVGAGLSAGIQQANNDFPSWGQGAQGYAKRFSASYGNIFLGTMLGSAVLPSILKQDPRYFYKGTGTTRSRIRYALVSAFMCKGDNQRWQFNYSGILGTAAASGLSNVYYPAADRDGAGLTFGNMAIGIAGSAISNIFQEFLIPKLTPHKPPLPQSSPQPSHP
jgi:hypothetical protein